MTKSNFNEQLYFAYGSNINLEQMNWRCPEAEVFGAAVLEGYELLFRGNSSRGGGAVWQPLLLKRAAGFMVCCGE